jgi:ligand-binding sensor domain-containing protein/signal transduction histidine kinase
MLLNIKILLLCAFLLPALWAWNQQPVQYAFTHYRMAEGLASNIVNNVVQDYKGYIWLSTINGLQRFDGNKFITFKSNPGQPFALPWDDIMQVYEDRNKNLWVLTNDNKVGIFNTYTFRYREVPVRQRDRETISVVKRFVETSDGNLLLHFSKSNKLFQFSPAEYAFIPSTEVPFLQNRLVNYLIQDKVTQKFFMATDSGFVVYNPNTKNLSYQNHNTENEPLITHYGTERFVNYMYIDARRNMFFEQWNTSDIHPLIKVFDFKTNTKKEYNLKALYGFGFHYWEALLEQRNGTIWMYGLPFLAEYTTNKDPFLFLKKHYNKDKDLKFNEVYSMYEDRQQNVWICTDYGVYLFNPDAQIFHNYTLTAPNRFAVEGRAQTALHLPNGEIWIGYRDLGLYRYDQNINPLPLPASIVPFQNMKSVWDIHLHSKTGTLWIGLQGGKLIVYDTATKRARLLAPPSFEQRAVVQITEDKRGDLWFGTQPGNLVKWNHNVGMDNIEAGFKLVKKTGVIDKMLTDSKGFIWLTAAGEGVLKIDPARNTVIGQISKSNTEGYRLWNNDPKDIIQYNDSLLFVASAALNVININNNRVTHISTHDGLPSNTVVSLAKDATGVLWLGTLNGLCRADVNKFSFAMYDQRDGVPDEDFNVAGAYALSDGRLLFTCAENFTVFNPLETRITGTVQKPFITDFKLSSISLSVDSLLALDKAKLSYNQNSVSFEFSALNYSKQNKLDYFYQLDGLDTTWIKSDDRHQAVYNFLPPGHYQFRVKTKNMEGVYSNDIAYLNLWVAPPFWKTWWFYMFLVLVVALVLYLIDRERVRRLVSLYDVRSDIAKHLHMDVTTTLNSINVLSQIAKLKADRDIERSKELIDEISDKSYNMVANMEEILWSIDPSNDSMEKTLLRIFEHSEALKTNFGTDIDIVVHEKVKHLQLDMNLRHDFLIICKEALQSLAPVSKGKSILVDIDLVRSKILLKILSIGFDTDESYTKLMQLKKSMTGKAEAMHASLNFETGKRETSIFLSVPLQ